MPFTLSHAAAALPFGKFKPIWPALVIGTFAPDLQYFIWISDEDRSGHHFPGVFLLSIPLAIAMLWLFEWCVKRPIVELLPSGVQRRLQDKLRPLSFWGWRQFASIVLWIIIGIATHLVWDQFTHSNSRLAAHWSLLRTTVVTLPFLYPQSAARALQNVSTIAGLLILGVWFVAWYRRTPPVPASQMRELSPFVKVAVVFAIIVIALFAGYPYALFTLSDHEGPISHSYLVATVFEAVTLMFCIELLLYGTVLTFAARSRSLRLTQIDEPAVDQHPENQTTSAGR